MQNKLYGILQESTLANIFFVCADLSERIFNMVLEIATKYRKLQLKGQRATKKVLQNIKCQADFPYAKIKCMRGDVTEEELVQILGQVVSKEKSLAEMESDLVRIKEMRALQCFFVKYSNCTSWQDAQKRYDTRWCYTILDFQKSELK